MTDRKTFYTSQLHEHQASLKKVNKQLFASSMMRLGLFILVCLAVYFFFEMTKLTIATIIIGVIGFAFLISRHSNLSFRKKFLNALIDIQQRELQVLQRDFLDFPDGTVYKNDQHFYSHDIDLFGKGSFFQYINRTATQNGTEKLAKKLTENNIDHIPKKQEALKELSQKTLWRHKFSAHATVSSSETTTNQIVSILNNHRFFSPKIARFLPGIFTAISAGVFTLYFTGFISELQLVLWFFIGLGITGIYVKKVNDLSSKMGKTQQVFYQHEQLIRLIENESFSSEMMKTLQEKIVLEHKKASVVIKQFARLLDALDQRNNMVFGFVANGLALWDMHQSYRIENWMQRYAKSVESWFDVIAEIDALNSLANVVFNHPNYTFPEIDKNRKKIISANEFTHPLLDPSKAVANDFEISDEEFLIITGANMAGKSTFLRTVSLGIVMANAGLPVCASSFVYTPIKLITSMRTSDSLTDDESYFFSELKRLKFIVDQIQQDTYFIVLDEILKGTNSTDKANGSKKFIEKLVSSNSTGLIATHDLSLCKVSESFDEVKNYYFDAEIINDELYFDYTLKSGVAQNMNASFLLKKMKIVDD